MRHTPYRIVVVGGGLSGLAAAFRIRQQIPSASIVVLEKQGQPGGNIQTVERDGFRIECGPNGFLDAKPFTLDLCRDIGLGDRLIAGSEGARKNRYLFRNGRLQALPGSLLSFIGSPVLSIRGKLNLLAEKYRRRPADVPLDESVAEFARRRAGQEVADVFADALVTGIHAGDPALLSVAAAFPRLTQFEREYGSVTRGVTASSRQKRADAKARGEQYRPQQMWSFREGLQVLVEGLKASLGPALVTGVGVSRIEQAPDGRWLVCGDGRDSWRADTVVLTTPANEQAAAVADLDADLAAEMAGIAYNPVAVVALGFRQTDVPRRGLDGFGYIASQNTRRDVLGVQWCSSIFPGRAPEGMVLWRALCGGGNRADVFDWDDARLVAAVRAELSVAMGVTAEPAFVHIVRWPRAIPQYNVGHLARVARIDARVAELPGLLVGGNAYRGVALNDCTEQAGRLADEVASYFSRDFGPT